MNDLIEKLTLQVIKTQQNLYNNAHYPKKDSKDKLICQLCGGKYARCVKVIHETRKKHIVAEKLLHDDIENVVKKHW